MSNWRASSHLPTVVFLHGFTGSASTWREVRDEFKDKYRTIAVDLTGHGKTTVPDDPERYSMEEQIEDLETLFEHFRLGLLLFGRLFDGRTNCIGVYDPLSRTGESTDS